MTALVCVDQCSYVGGQRDKSMDRWCLSAIATFFTLCALFDERIDGSIVGVSRYMTEWLFASVRTVNMYIPSSAHKRAQ